MLISQIVTTISIGKKRKIKKLINTLKFKKKTKKNNFIVTFRFKIVILIDSHIAEKTSFLFITIAYFE
ncbi:MAG: hypothetical protein LBD88_01650 [Candidatus Peribacteria bacterium]|nr:hypothetical protein [Candidatus Peribacteria bacterium]